MAPPRSAPAPTAVLLLLALAVAVAAAVIVPAVGLEVLSKFPLERCARDSGAGGRLACDRKIVLDMAVPSGDSGGEASLVAQVKEVEENDTQAMHTIRDPPVITINKSAVYALYDITYVRDVAYKPEEQFVKTRKCESDAGADVVKSCERLWDQNGHLIEYTEPVCCPCGPNQRVPSSCGSFFGKMVKGKANTAHCLRFPGDWYHVFGIGKRSLGFSIRVQVKKGSSVTEVIVGPDNRTVVSKDNFLRVDLVGDFAGYTSMPTFEDFYLVTPRKGDTGGQPEVLGDDFSRWMLLERTRFTSDGLECNKIGVGYEAFRNQPNFCSSEFRSCLHGQLWNFWEADKNRIDRKQQPLCVVEGKYQRINQHPNAGAHTFSLGITEVLTSNLLIELSADDIEFVYQRSPGKIISINVPTFEALSQVGTAQVKTKNIGKLEASYSLTFDCLGGIHKLQEQFFIMKPDEVLNRSFDLYASTDQASKYRCVAILKASDFSELDRAECQFSATATVLDNGTQTISIISSLRPVCKIGPSNDHAKGGIKGFFEAIKAFWHNMWDGLIDFFTGRSCSSRCLSFFDLSCHIQYICIGWLVMMVLLLATLPAVAVLLWLLHQKGLFDPLYYWLEDVFGRETHERTRLKHKKGRGHHHHHHPHGDHHHKHHHARRRRDIGPSHHHILHRQLDPAAAAEGERDYRRGRHDAALGVLHWDQGQKHRHGKAMAVAEPPREGLGSRQAPWPREVGGGGGEHMESRHHGHRRERHRSPRPVYSV